ncbi:MAG: hypothetical protein JJT88_18000 [Gammaproteobacteria bacterium]|nr:hypothetical protein [Gammaproteobacteria bacterium]
MPRRHCKLSLIALLLAIGLSPSQLAAAADPIDLDPRAALRIENLLADAEVALAAMRLTTPGYDNAYDRYRQVLDFLPGDTRALTGINRIADAYFGLALAAAENRNHSEARRLFELGLKVAPEHGSAGTVERSIERLLAAPVARMALNAEALRAFDNDLGQQLAELGAKAKRENLLVVIQVPRDDLGRWVYQRMNAAPPNTRLRARSEIGSPAEVTLRREN